MDRPAKFRNFVGIMEKLEPALYLFPVGLSDVGPAAVLPQLNLELMGAVRHFVVENLRTARRSLRRALPNFPIDECSFVELSEHTSPSEVAAMLAPLEQGYPLGVLSEAGCPAVADPGADLVAVAQQRGLKVVPLVGPSSILLGLMASGFNGQRFAFGGYLPIEPDQRKKRLQQMLRRIDSEGETQIFIETPYRNQRLLTELTSGVLPSHMRLCIGQDITGPEQQILTLSLAQWRQKLASGFALPKLPCIYLLYKA